MSEALLEGGTRCLRNVLGRFATGVVAVAAADPADGTRAGLVANSFCSVSLEPALVSFCVAHTSGSWPLMRGAGLLAISILGAQQRAAADRLAASGTDKFHGLPWISSPGGAPVLEGSLAWLECTVEAEHPAGDHTIVVARVRALDAIADGEPLLFYRGTFGGFSR
ncbi:flavin reductase family protein [Actinacidiphila epipremni]|jgi:flavin reductase (DIM6/NTAB) family NADH-FMN oxidoreductase RutF|uniref:Flavin reductase family protein n=1 Tax=Actinacidiphila epipremni TaxID=2053013 RepID=A0ABX0ZRG2_9ACTN|nr:flavin reductase family protein [Actinacidiphila epipremni]NJP45192.1 flavin reductase family protein [Actinacidiphila epipremni]